MKFKVGDRVKHPVNPNIYRVISTNPQRNTFGLLKESEGYSYPVCPTDGYYVVSTLKIGARVRFDTRWGDKTGELAQFDPDAGLWRIKCDDGRDYWLHAVDLEEVTKPMGHSCIILAPSFIPPAKIDLHVGAPPKKQLHDKCPKCQDEGEWRMMALFCRKGHGKICG